MYVQLIVPMADCLSLEFKSLAANMLTARTPQWTFNIPV